VPERRSGVFNDKKSTVCVCTRAYIYIYIYNNSTLDIGVLGYISILYHKEHPPEVWHIPLGTPVYIYIFLCEYNCYRINIAIPLFVKMSILYSVYMCMCVCVYIYHMFIL
jgi:hypothetical protein